MEFVNCYEDAARARAYATLEFANTYYLAYRDLPAIFSEHIVGTGALDFGCGTGRSTRFLQRLGFTVTGVDISEDMLHIARETDPPGDYCLVPGDDLSGLAAESFDLVLSAFTLDNIPAAEKVGILADLGGLLAPRGMIVSVVSSPDIYTHEWASFSTRDFPENQRARDGDRVRTIVTDHHDDRPVEDIFCTDTAYQAVYQEAGLQVVRSYRPLATGDEPYAWVHETTIPPWVIYVLQRQAATE
jgi:SAM-dependent methyltransferase